MIRGRAGVTAGLGGIGLLIGVLLLVIRKGPMAALVVLLAMSVLVLVLSVVQAFVGRKNG